MWEFILESIEQLSEYDQMLCQRDLSPCLCVVDLHLQKAWSVQYLISLSVAFIKKVKEHWVLLYASVCQASS